MTALTPEQTAKAIRHMGYAPEDAGAQVALLKLDDAGVAEVQRRLPDLDNAEDAAKAHTCRWNIARDDLCRATRIPAGPNIGPRTADGVQS